MYTKLNFISLSGIPTCIEIHYLHSPSQDNGEVSFPIMSTRFFLTWGILGRLKIKKYIQWLNFNSKLCMNLFRNRCLLPYIIIYYNIYTNIIRNCSGSGGWGCCSSKGDDDREIWEKEKKGDNSIMNVAKCIVANSYSMIYNSIT